MTEFLHSPLHAEHEKLGATFTPFGPWEMPLKYDNELDEHRAVRNAAGLYDLSHMGEIWVNGPDAAAFLGFLRGAVARRSFEAQGFAVLGRSDSGS